MGELVAPMRWGNGSSQQKWRAVLGTERLRNYTTEINNKRDYLVYYACTYKYRPTASYSNTLRWRMRLLASRIDLI